MTVRLRLALTILLTGLVTACGVIVAVALVFQRVEHENTWQRGDAFLGRVAMQHADLLEQQQRDPDGFAIFLKSLLLYEPASQLYLLDAAGTVLAHTGRMPLPAGFKVSLPPVRQAAAAAGSADRRAAAYVMGDDPEYMAADAVVAARVLRRSSIRPAGDADGYLYLVCRKPGLPVARADLLQGLASPALLPVLLVCLLTSALAAWIIVAVTRPLRVLSDEVAHAARAGFSTGSTAGVPAPAAGAAPDEFGRLRSGFHALLATLRLQWDELSKLDRFRRESVSNLSHDLRSPLTATVACLETLENRWAGDVSREGDRQLVSVALRNTRNAAGLVRSLGDLALLDEPEFKLRPMRLDLSEVLDDIRLRFAQRAAKQGVALEFEPRGQAPAVAEVDIELLERAIANLLDNAFKFTPPGGRVVLTAERDGGQVRLTVADSGRGIPAADLPHLFDRLYQARTDVEPASSDEGKGLGLSIVRRIVELHRGTVLAESRPGAGTTVTITLPAG